MKKNFSKIFALLIICASITPVLAGKLSYEYEARALYDMGLYKGISETTYVPDLDSNLTREQAVVILIRLFGQEDEVSKISDSKVRATLAKFKDAYEVSSWAKKEVTYAVSKGYIKGIETEDGFYFKPGDSLKGLDYACLILQQLNISNFEYGKALDKLQTEGIISKNQKVAFNKEELTRDDVVGISYSVLKAEKNNNKTVIQDLVDLGKVNKNTAVKLGLIDNDATEPIPIPIQKPTQTVSPVPVITVEPKISPTPTPIASNEDTDLKRASNAVKLGQWTISNSSREAMKINRVWFTAEYGGQSTRHLNPAYIVDYSVEDIDGNVYAVFSSISGGDIAQEEVYLTKPFVVPAMMDQNATEKDLVLYAKILEGAPYGSTIEILLGDGNNLFEATGEKTGAKIVKTGDMIRQENGKKVISISKLVPTSVDYSRQPLRKENASVVAFKLENKGPKAVLLKQVKLKEVYSSAGSNKYILRNEEMNIISSATANNGQIVFEIAEGEKIYANESELLSVELENKPLSGSSVKLKLLKEGTCYDSIDEAGFAINIDDDLLFDEVIYRDN